MCRWATIQTFRSPLPDLPSFSIIQAKVLLVEEGQEVIECVLISSFSGPSLIGGRRLVEICDGESGALEGLNKLLRWRV